MTDAFSKAQGDLAATSSAVQGMTYRLDALAQVVGELKGSVATAIVKMESELRTQRTDIERDLEQFVEKVEFEPVKKIVFGMVGTMLLAVLTALMAIIIQRGHS